MEGGGPLSKAPDPQLLRGPCYEVLLQGWTAGTHSSTSPSTKAFYHFRTNQSSIKQFGIFATLILTHFKMNTHCLLFMFKTDFIQCVCTCLFISLILTMGSDYLSPRTRAASG